MTTRAVGFFLVVHNNNDIDDEEEGGGGGGRRRRRRRATERTEYQLVIPYILLKPVCDAARFQYTVKVSKHVIVLDENIRRNGRSSSSSSSEQQQQQKQQQQPPSALPVLELDTDGFELIHDGHNNNNSSYRGTAMSLTEFRTLERATNRQNDTFDITATVDAISPIIAAVPLDPFCLLELYDEPPLHNHHHNDDDDDYYMLPPAATAEAVVPCCCVVILKGIRALICHAGIQPGDVLTLTRVRRQKWHVPWYLDTKRPTTTTGLQSSRVPFHVLVITDASSIHWQQQPQQQQQHPTLSSLSSSFSSPLLPWTVIPLVSLRGCIVFVKTSSGGHKNGSRHVIYCIGLQRNTNTDTTCPTAAAVAEATVADTFLYVSHYPMSPDLLYGIRPGAILCAINVHKLSFVHNRNHHHHHPQQQQQQLISNYGACLRSTIFLERVASENGENNDNKTVLSPNVNRGMVPFAFWQIRHDYCRLELCRYLDSCGVYNRVHRLYMKFGLSPGPPLPNLDSIADAILHQHDVVVKQQGLNSPCHPKKIKKNKRRDPYAEFFDHAGENEHESSCEEDYSGCRLSRQADHTFGFPPL